MVDARARLAARIYLRAVLPVMKVLIEDVPRNRRRFESITARVQFAARDVAGPVAGYLMFDRGALAIGEGLCEQPDVVFSFGSVARMNAFFAGKPALPRIRGWRRPVVLARVLSLLMGLKLLMPQADPRDAARRRLKVKMTFYMITTALSQYNKGGDPEMERWTSRQPERIYQISVDEGIAAYLRVKAGKTKAGRGVYPRRRPFVHMRFNGVEGAYPIVMNRVNMVDAVRQGLLSIEGSPEYARDIGDFMMRIQTLIT